MYVGVCVCACVFLRKLAAFQLLQDEQPRHKTKDEATEPKRLLHSPQFLKGSIFFFFFLHECADLTFTSLAGDDLKGLFETKQDSSVPSRTAKIRHRAI